MIKPVEEVFFRGAGFPFGMVFAQITAVAVFDVYHFEEVGEVHCFRAFDALLLLGKPLLAAILALGVCDRCARRGGGREGGFFVGVGTAGDFGGDGPFLVGSGIRTASRRWRGSIVLDCRSTWAGGDQGTVLGFFDCLMLWRQLSSNGTIAVRPSTSQFGDGRM